MLATSLVDAWHATAYPRVPSQSEQGRACRSRRYHPFEYDTTLQAALQYSMMGDENCQGDFDLADSSLTSGVVQRDRASDYSEMKAVLTDW